MRSLLLVVMGATGLAIAAMSAQATQLPQLPDTNSSIVQVAGGCGPGFHPVPGHWSRWREWVPPHCAPNHDYPTPYYGARYPYAGYPYGYRHNYWPGY